MFIVDILIPLFLLIPLSIYIYYIVNRGIKLLFTQFKRRYIIIITMLIVLPAINIWGIWFLILLHLTVFNLILELINIPLKRIKNKKFQWVWRYFFNGFSLPIFLTLILFIYGYKNISNVHKTTYSIVSNKSISQQYKLAVISDLHFGNALNSSSIKKYIDEITNENPDIVILLGDIVDEKTSLMDMEKIFQDLAQIKNNFGIYYIYGNHDINYYGSKNFSRLQLKNALEKANIKVLKDTNVVINNELTVIGRKDFSDLNRSSLSDLYNNLANKDNFLLLLDHQPVNLMENIKAKFDLQLSGHTHNGQIFPAGILNKFLGITEMNYGYKKIGDFQIIVTSGISGWGYPIRTEGISEYVIIDINKKE